MYRLLLENCKAEYDKCIMRACKVSDPRLAALLIEDILYMLGVKCMVGGEDPPLKIDCHVVGDEVQIDIYKHGGCIRLGIIGSPEGPLCLVDVCGRGHHEALEEHGGGEEASGDILA